MIAKHNSMQSARRSSFKELVAYITHAKDKTVRIGEVRVTNCHQEDAADAVNEVLATQLQNKRACSDKTYHLLISFPAGEQPAAEALRGIEDEVCNALGFGEHQRVSAVHTDTDNLHIHVAINKIHPRTLAIHNPYCDYKALGAVCERLELSHGLIRTNHERIALGARSRALDMENAAGVESLLGWIRRECLEDLRQAQSWGELHERLSRNGLALNERGNGLVVSDQEGRAVKASSIARDLSKAQLVKRLGPYEGYGQRLAPAARSYQPRPVSSDPGTDELYQRYRVEQAERRQVLQQARRDLREQKRHLVSEAKDRARIKRGLIRQLDCGRFMKRMLYHQVSAGLRDDIQAIHEQERTQRATSPANAKPKSWFDWLAERAARNDAQALAALRRRQCRAARRANCLLGAMPRQGAAIAQDVAIDGLRIDSVTKQGTIIYAQGKSAIRDSGLRLEVSDAIRQDGLEVALNLALKRFGQHIAIEGDAAFRDRVLHAAKALKLDIAFADRTQRQAQSKALPDKPEAQSTRRTDAGGASVAAGAGEEAARRYISERETKRQQIADIPRHVLGEIKPREEIRYAGWRRVDEQFLLLARTGADEIAVIPVDSVVIARVSGLKRGEAIVLDGAQLQQSRGLAR